jgi:hypothetical protein
MIRIKLLMDKLKIMIKIIYSLLKVIKISALIMIEK